MKFTAAAIVALFVASPAAAQTTNFLEQNVLCGDSKDCESRCRDGRYHIVAEGGSTYFGCAQKADNTRNQGYDNPDCRFGTGDGKGEAPRAQAACSAAGGKVVPDDVPRRQHVQLLHHHPLGGAQVRSGVQSGQRDRGEK